MKCIAITQDVYNSIMDTIGSLPSETGGILASDQTGIVSAFYFDHAARRESLIYRPSLEALSQVINTVWFPNQLVFCGFVHSHPFKSAPSSRDIKSCLQIMRCNYLSTFIMPIVADAVLTMYVLERYQNKAYHLSLADFEIV